MLPDWKPCKIYWDKHFSINFPHIYTDNISRKPAMTIHTEVT